MPFRLPVKSVLQIRTCARVISTGVCPAYAFTRSFKALGQLRHQRYGPRTCTRDASLLASSTAINATKEIPPAFAQLHQALENVKKKGARYVNLSRLELALRGLESDRPTIRIAILGLYNQRSARRLARLLLADALSSEGAWEEELETVGQDDNRGLVLRYGEVDDPTASNGLLNILHIPSRILAKHNLEVLVSSLSLDWDTTAAPATVEHLKDAALVPAAETPKSYSGGMSLVTYPVHRAIVLADGLEGCLSIGRYMGAHVEGARRHVNILRIVLNLEMIPRSEKQSDLARDLDIVSTSQAAEALEKFRETNTNASFYEQGWFASGMPPVTEWFFKDSNVGADVNMALKDLIADVLDDAYLDISRDDQARSQELDMARTSDQLKLPLEDALKTWATQGHTELRDRLDMAFASKEWAKLRWWKLFWRIDDVGMILIELLERNWLVEAEKGVIWLSGRGMQAGLFGEDSYDNLQPSGKHRSGTVVDVTSTDLSPAYETDTHTLLGVSPAQAPWPLRIPNTRAILQTTTVPTLQSLAQSLVLQSLSITSVSTFLSILLYVSFPTFTVYEAGAVAALGLVWSLRQLQKSWETGRMEWMGEVREVGRLTLKETEDGFREVVIRAGERAKGTVEDVQEVEDRRMAREAVEECRRALDGIPAEMGKSEARHELGIERAYAGS